MVSFWASLHRTASLTVIQKGRVVADYGVVFGYTRDGDAGRAENVADNATYCMVCSISQDGGHPWI